jgi:hypothetical protein
VLRIGLPLTIGLGTLAAFTLPGVSDIWLAVLVGAALARIDAALGAAVMVNPAVPARIRRLINVESGLNDGIAAPFVLVAIARRGDCRACRQRRGPGRRGSCLTLRLPAPSVETLAGTRRGIATLLLFLPALAHPAAPRHEAAVARMCRAPRQPRAPLDGPAGGRGSASGHRPRRY